MKESCIHHVPVFRNLTEPEIEDLHSVIQARRYEKGEFIFREGDSSDTLYVLHHGIVKIFKCSETGKEQVIRFLFPGDFFGQASLLQTQTHYADAEVLEPASICLIHKADFTRLLENNPQMTYRFLLAMSDRLQQADEWMSTISLADVEARLAKTLLLFYQKAEPCKSSFRLPIAKREMAALLGTTPETLSRKLTHLESLRILAPEGRNGIRILDMGQLTRIAGTLPSA